MPADELQSFIRTNLRSVWELELLLLTHVTRSFPIAHIVRGSPSDVQPSATMRISSVRTADVADYGRRTHIWHCSLYAAARPAWACSTRRRGDLQDVTYRRPATIQEAVQLLKDNGPTARVLAGGTDMPAHGVLASNGHLHEAVLARLAAG